jgi:hypothetical protein
MSSMDRRQRIVLATLGIGLAIVAVARLTAGPGVPTFRVEFPQGEIERPLTVVVEDHTGAVSAAERTAMPEDRDPDGNVGSSRGDGDASAVTLWWVGGACERETTVRVTTRTGGGLHVDIRSGQGLIGSCPAVGILRAIRVQFEAPIDLSDVAISYEPA